MAQPERIEGDMRLPDSAHTSKPWRIHELTPDFRLEDVWGLTTPDRDDFDRLVDQVGAFDPGADFSSPVLKLLFGARRVLGTVFRWDEPVAGPDGKLPTLLDRLPADLRDTHLRDTDPGDTDLRNTGRRDTAAVGAGGSPAVPLYRLEDEWAAEIVNKTVHGVLHLGRVRDPADGYRVQLAILVKRHGRLGAVYMAAIKPFRHLIVYPVMTREFEAALRRPPASR